MPDGKSPDMTPEINVNPEKPSGKENPKTENELAKRMMAAGIDLNSIKDPRLRAFIKRVGSQPPSRYSAQYLNDQLNLLDGHQGQADLNPNIERFDDKQLDAITVPLNEWIAELGQIEDKNNPLRQMAENQKLQTQAELQEIIAGQDDFFRSIFFQRQNTTDLGKETWYNPLSEREQILLGLNNKFLLAANGIESLPGRKAGPLKGFEAYKTFLHIRKEELECQFESVGFSIAFGTLINDLFEYGELNPNRKADEGTLKGLIISDKGKKIIQDQDKDTKEQKFSKYRDDIVKKLERYFKENPQEIEFGLLKYPSLTAEMRNKQIRIAAEGYFGMAWNFLSIGNAIESGDNTRAITSSDPTVIATSWRNMIHAHDQAKNKWVRGIPEKVGTEEDLFGILGRWAQERIRHDPNFRQRFDKYQPGFRYFQRVTTGSIFDHAYFLDNKTTLSEIFTDSGNIHKINGHDLYKFKMPTGISFRELRDTDIGYVYTDILDSVIKIQTLLTTSEQLKDPQVFFAAFVGGLQSLQGRAVKIDDATGAQTIQDRLLWEIYKPDLKTIEDLVIAGIGAAGGGFKQFTSKLMVEVGNTQYDRFFYNLLQDDRIFKILGAQPGSLQIREIRKRIYSRLNVHDINTWSGAQASTRDAALMGGPRTKIINEIMENRRKFLGS